MHSNFSKRLLYFFILESFNTNISHQLFGYKITFIISQQKNTNKKKGFCTQNQIKRLFKDLWYLKINPTQIWYNIFNLNAFEVNTKF